MSNSKECWAIGCQNSTRTKTHHFCSYCWFKVSKRLRASYYRAIGSSDEYAVDKAVTNVIRSLRRNHAPVDLRD